MLLSANEGRPGEEKEKEKEKGMTYSRAIPTIMHTER